MRKNDGRIKLAGQLLSRVCRKAQSLTCERGQLLESQFQVGRSVEAPDGNAARAWPREQFDAGIRLARVQHMR